VTSARQQRKPTAWCAVPLEPSQQTKGNDCSSVSRWTSSALYPAVGHKYEEDADKRAQIQQRATKTVRGLKYRTCEEKVREVSLSTLQKG